MISLAIDKRPIRRLKITKREFNNWVRPGFRKMLDTLLAFSKVKHNWKTRTGITANSLQSTMSRDGLSGRIHSITPVSKFLYYGTKRHWVEPVRASALSWVQDGTRRFSKGHFVSGIKAEPWVEDNYESREQRFNRMIENSIVEGMAKKWS